MKVIWITEIHALQQLTSNPRTMAPKIHDEHDILHSGCRHRYVVPQSRQVFRKKNVEPCPHIISQILPASKFAKLTWRILPKIQKKTKKVLPQRNNRYRGTCTCSKYQVASTNQQFTHETFVLVVPTNLPNKTIVLLPVQPFSHK